MQTPNQNDAATAGVTIVERINGWWVEENSEGQRRLHGPYPDETTAQSEAALLGGATAQVAIELPAGSAVDIKPAAGAGADAEAQADQARAQPGD